MKVSLVQLRIAWEDQSKNFQRVRRLLRETPPAAGSLVVLPEMFATGFTMSAADVAETRIGPILAFLRELATEWKVGVVGGLVVSSKPGLARNQAVVLGADGRELGRYAKIQLFTPGGEVDHYRPGTRLGLFRWRRSTLAVFICYDLRFPELFRVAVRKGAEMLVVIANWPARRHRHWTTLLQARAIENQAFVVGVNRCGRDPNHVYAGGSMVVGPKGEVLARAGRGETVLAATLDLPALRQWRREFPALRDLRCDIRIRKARAVSLARRD